MGCSETETPSVPPKPEFCICEDGLVHFRRCFLLKSTFSGDAAKRKIDYLNHSLVTKMAPQCHPLNVD